MISIAYLFEGKVLEHLKRHKGKYALGGAAAGLYYSDDITPDPVKNVIRRWVTGKETIQSSEDLLKGYENHPRYHELKAIADQLDKKDLNRLTGFGIHNRQTLPLPRGVNIPPGVEISGYHSYKPIFQNFRAREIRIRDDVPNADVVKVFKHELGHHIDTEKKAYRKTLRDIDRPYGYNVREYVAHRFEQDHRPGESYRDFIKRVRDEGEKMSDIERSKKIEEVMRNRAKLLKKLIGKI